MATGKAELAEECNAMEEIVFHVHSDIYKNEKVQCSGKEHQTLKEAIEKQKHLVLSCPINEYIFKANVKGHSEQVDVNPNILICGWLERDTKIQTYRLSPSETKKLPEPQVEMENVSHVSDQTLFFLDIDRPKNTRIITHIPHDKYKAKHLCVSAVKGETLLKALEKDGRFIKPENWILNSYNSLSKVLVETEARLCENYVFDIEFCTRKRYLGLSDESVSKSGTTPNWQIKKEKLEDGEVNHVSSPSPMPAEDMHTSPVNSFHQNILVSAKSHANKLIKGSRRKKLATLSEEKFSKPIDQSKSVWLMKQLVSASECVGRISAECCPTAGTCFRVTEDVILTNYHVYEDIKRDVAARQDNPKVKVSFNYEWPNQTSDFHEVEVNMKDIRARSEDECLDYIFLGLKDKRVEPALGERISFVDPRNITNEVVTIIGHPDGREKKIDPECRIISQHIWRSELLDRIQKLQPLEFNPLFTCKKKIMSDDYKHKIAYDSSFFHGASGSPVFDDQGQVIAMHTCGWVEKSAERKYIMEFAIPMEVIYSDCYCKNSGVANMLFPSFSMNVE